MANLNRAQRRAAGRTRQPNRSRVQCSNHFTLEFETFDSIERMFQQLRNGALLYRQGEGWEIMGLSGEMLDIESALAGWLQYWKELAERVDVAYDDAALVRIANALKYHKPLTHKEIDAAYAVVAYQRHLYRTIPKSVTTSVVHDVRKSIKTTDAIRELLA